MTTKPLTRIWRELKAEWLNSYTKEYTRVYMRKKRQMQRINRVREARTLENFTEEDIIYIKSIEIWNQI